MGGLELAGTKTQLAYHMRKNVIVSASPPVVSAAQKDQVSVVTAVEAAVPAVSFPAWACRAAPDSSFQMA